MAHPARGRRAEGADPFPWVVCLVSVAIGLTILFRSTIPGLTEQQDLRRVEQGKRTELDQTMHEAADLRARRARLEQDPETVLIELDRHGIDPADLPAEPAPSADGKSVDRQAAADPRTGAATNQPGKTPARPR